VGLACAAVSPGVLASVTTGLVAVGPAGLAESRYSLCKRDPSSLTGGFHQLLLMNGVGSADLLRYRVQRV
jgi:hypothetical protein